jgi:TonB family protein
MGGEVDSSSGYERLDRATIDALIICKFKPALENGKPVEGDAVITYIWRVQ